MSYDCAPKSSGVYEGCISSLIVGTSSRRGATVTYEDVYEAKASSPPPSGQGRVIWTATAIPSLLAVIEFDGAPALEIHLGGAR